jgi:hypothetical protein
VFVGDNAARLVRRKGGCTPIGHSLALDPIP